MDADLEAILEEDYLEEIGQKAKARVSAGMGYLDKTYPNHLETVDIETIDIESTRNCVLAQAMGIPYVRIEIPTEFAKSLGFYAETDMESEWDILTEEWKEQYRARKA